MQQCHYSSLLISTRIISIRIRQLLSPPSPNLSRIAWLGPFFLPTRLYILYIIIWHLWSVGTQPKDAECKMCCALWINCSRRFCVCSQIVTSTTTIHLAPKRHLVPESFPMCVCVNTLTLIEFNKSLILHIFIKIVLHFCNYKSFDDRRNNVGD